MAQYSQSLDLGGWSDYCWGIDGTVSVRLPNDGHCLSVDSAGAVNLRLAALIIGLPFLAAALLCWQCWRIYWVYPYSGFGQADGHREGKN